MGMTVGETVAGQRHFPAGGRGRGQLASGRLNSRIAEGDKPSKARLTDLLGAPLRRGGV